MTADDVRDGLARALIEAWAKAEPEHTITKNPSSYVATFVDLADAALAYLAARRSTAPEVVTTAAELDALPVGSVVLDGMGTAWQHTHQSEWKSHSRGWSAWGSPDLAILRGPFRVPYRPTVDGER